jgi:hypothetical protein
MMQRGGHFLYEESSAKDVFTPEELTEQHKMIAQTATRFVEKKVLTHLEDIERFSELIDDQAMERNRRIADEQNKMHQIIRS